MVFKIKLEHACVCGWLNQEYNPMEIKEIFSEKDDLVIIWARVKEVKSDSEIEMIWLNPNNKETINISVLVEKTTEERKYRNVWTVAETKGLKLLENCYGKWTVLIKHNEDVLAKYQFEFKNILAIYNSSKKVSDIENISTFDFSG